MKGQDRDGFGTPALNVPRRNLQSLSGFAPRSVAALIGRQQQMPQPLLLPIFLERFVDDVPQRRFRVGDARYLTQRLSQRERP